MRTPRTWTTDTDLDALRKRADFQALLAARTGKAEVDHLPESLTASLAAQLRQPGGARLAQHLGQRPRSASGGA